MRHSLGLVALLFACGPAPAPHFVGPDPRALESLFADSQPLAA